MIKLQPGQSLAQFTGVSPAPLIHNFVNTQNFIKPDFQAKNSNVIKKTK